MGGVCGQLETQNKSPKLKYHSDASQDISKTSSKTNQLKNLKLTKFDPIEDHYDIIHPEIGVGGSGKVYKVISKISKQVLVAKRVKKLVFNSLLQIQRQIKILKNLNHKNIVNIYQIFINDPWIYIVMEYCEGGELFEKIKRENCITQTMAARWMVEILDGISHCHSKQIIHGDLKPQNIMFKSSATDSSLKIIDFGSSSVYKNKKRNDDKQILSGTIYYVSPQFFQKQVTTKGDMWACGVILYIMLSGQPPFNGKSDQEITSRIIKGEYSLDQAIWGNISDEAKSFIKQLLCVDPKVRISASNALNHQWIQKYKQNNLKDTNLKQTITNMQKFCKGTMFQNSMLKFLSTHVLAEDYKKSLISQFKQIDVNGDGRITFQELKDSLKTYQKEDVLGMFSEIDTDNSGFIVYEQFVVSAIEKKKYLTVRKLSQMFDTIDTNKDGVLSKEEIQKVIGRSLTPTAFKQLMRSQNTNEKGQVRWLLFQMSKARFIQSMKKLVQC